MEAARYGSTDHPKSLSQLRSVRFNARRVQISHRNLTILSFVRRKLEERRKREEARGHVMTQTSFDSESSFEFEPDRISLRSVLHRMSSIFHSYLGGGGGLSRQGSRRDSPSPSASAASTSVSRQSSTRRDRSASTRTTTGKQPARNSALLDVLLPGPGSRRSSIWSLGTMVVSAQVNNLLTRSVVFCFQSYLEHSILFLHIPSFLLILAVFPHCKTWNNNVCVRRCKGILNFEIRS